MLLLWVDCLQYFCCDLVAVNFVLFVSALITYTYCFLFVSIYWYVRQFSGYFLRCALITPHIMLGSIQTVHEAHVLIKPLMYLLDK